MKLNNSKFTDSNFDLVEMFRNIIRLIIYSTTPFIIYSFEKQEFVPPQERAVQKYLKNVKICSLQNDHIYKYYKF